MACGSGVCNQGTCTDGGGCTPQQQGDTFQGASYSDTLSQPADPTSISVAIDGVALLATNPAGTPNWTFDVPSNTVNLNPANVVVSAGDTITISYTTLCPSGSCQPVPTLGTATVFPGPGGWPTQVPTNLSFVSADFNRDGIADLVSSQGTILYGLSDGGLEVGGTLDDSWAYQLQVADLNGDGWPDIVMEHCGPELAPGHVGIWMNQHDGTFSGYALQLVDGGVCTSSVAIADFNGDGVLDFAVCTLDGVQMLFGDGGFLTSAGGAPGFFPPQAVSSNQCDALATWPGLNGRAALATVDSSTDYEVVVWPEVWSSTGEFVAPTIYYQPDAGTEGIGWSIQAVDLNGDGLPDLVVGADNDGIAVFLGADDGTFKPGVITRPALGPVLNIVVADVNGDGYPDILSTGNGAACGLGGAVQLFLNDCGGGFNLGVLMDAGIANPMGVAVLPSLSGGLPSIAALDFCNGDVGVIPLLPDGGGQ